LHYFQLEGREFFVGNSEEWAKVDGVKELGQDIFFVWKGFGKEKNLSSMELESILPYLFAL
jgi:hypothetical protein